MCIKDKVKKFIDENGYKANVKHPTLNTTTPTQAEIIKYSDDLKFYNEFLSQVSAFNYSEERKVISFEFETKLTDKIETANKSIKKFEEGKVKHEKDINELISKIKKPQYSNDFFKFIKDTEVKENLEADLLTISQSNLNCKDGITLETNVLTETKNKLKIFNENVDAINRRDSEYVLDLDALLCNLHLIHSTNIYESPESYNKFNNKSRWKDDEYQEFCKSLRYRGIYKINNNETDNHIVVDLKRDTLNDYRGNDNNTYLKNVLEVSIKFISEYDVNRVKCNSVMLDYYEFTSTSVKNFKDEFVLAIKNKEFGEIERNIVTGKGYDDNYVEYLCYSKAHNVYLRAKWFIFGRNILKFNEKDVKDFHGIEVFYPIQDTRVYQTMNPEKSAKYYFNNNIKDQYDAKIIVNCSF